MQFSLGFLTPKLYHISLCVVVIAADDRITKIFFIWTLAVRYRNEMQNCRRLVVYRTYKTQGAMHLWCLIRTSWRGTYQDSSDEELRDKFETILHFISILDSETIKNHLSLLSRSDLATPSRKLFFNGAFDFSGIMRLKMCNE